MAPPPAARRTWRWLRFLGPAVMVLVWSIGLRLWVKDGLDLRDMPGAGGVKIVYALATGDYDRDWATWVAASFLPLFGGDVVQTCDTLVLLGGGLLAPLGALLCGWALAGRTAGLAAGLVAATWAQTVHTSLLIGGDGIAVGYAWLGVGVCWIAARLGWKGLPLAVAGALLASLGLTVKISVAPAVAFAGLMPLMGRRGGGAGAVACSVVALGTLLWAKETFIPGSSSHIQGPAAPDLATIRAGLAQIDAQTLAHPEGVVMRDVFWLGLAGALLPGRWWGRRWVVGLLAVAALGFAVATVGAKLRIRQLVLAPLPILVLAGVAVALVMDALRAGFRALPAWIRWAGGARWGLLVALVGLLFVDNLAFHNAWGNLRSRWADLRRPGLPPAPLVWREAYHRLSPLTFTDTTDVGALVFTEQGRTAPAAGAATVVLRDNREFHLLAGASLAGTPAVVWEAARCCEARKPTLACARTLVAQLDGAGARLVLPTDLGISKMPRVNQPHGTFLTYLRTAVAERGELQDVGRWWQRFDGKGGQVGAQLPCLRR